jgi:tRNA dimethylallyltransferase
MMSAMVRSFEQSKRPRLVIIVGPTGVGKTAAGIQTAREFGGEVISADSMQVYRFMDIGTAKPGAAERTSVAHHMIDVVNPDEEFNASMFAEQASGIIRFLSDEQKPVFVVGGTGLYIRALTGGLIESPEADLSFRQALRKMEQEFGKDYLFEKLKERDSRAAEKIHPNDTVRIIRALEVLEKQEESISALQERHRFGRADYDFIMIGLRMDRSRLIERIDRRAHEMVEKGLVGEVEKLLAMGYDETLKPMQSLGYKYFVKYVKGDLNLDEALHGMKRDTRRYARRQMTWFRAERKIAWVPWDDLDLIRKKAEEYLSC